MGCGYNSIQMGRLGLSSVVSPTAPSSNYEECANNSTYFEVANTGSMVSLQTQYLIQPIAVLGIPKRPGPTVMALADSRCNGTATGLNAVTGNYDPLDVDGNYGWFEKAISFTTGLMFAPYSNMSVGGDNLAAAFPTNSTLTGRQGRLKAIAMAMPTAVYLGLSFNDFATGKSLATVQAQEQQLIGEIKGLGVKYVFTDSTDPIASSSNSFVDTARQTLGTGSANIAARNAALRAGSYAPYDFFIDNAPYVESAVGSGKWAVNGTANYATGDGVHTSPALIKLKAANAAAVMAANIKF